MSYKIKRQQSVCQYCEDPAIALKMCAKHYQRFRKYGDPHHVISPRIRKGPRKFVEPVESSEVTRSKIHRQTSRKTRFMASNSVPTIVRSVDELGRIVLPRDYGTTQGINPYDALEFFESGNKIILKKYQPGCLFCGNIMDLTNFKGKLICRKCASETEKI